MTLSEIIVNIRISRGYENLKEILGKDLGSLIYNLIDKADESDRELEIVHQCITTLYNIADENSEPINNCLNQIQELKKLKKNKPSLPR